MVGEGGYSQVNSRGVEGTHLYKGNFVRAVASDGGRESTVASDDGENRWWRAMVGENRR